MDNTISMLFEALRKKFPYQPASQGETLVQSQAEHIYQQLREQHPALKHDLWLYRDCWQIMAYHRSLHCFALGLHAGMSMSKELASFNQD